jgi:hypothetical protein
VTLAPQITRPGLSQSAVTGPGLVTVKPLTVAQIKKLLSEPMHFDWLNVRHTLAGGLYTRTGILRAGQLAIGTMHRQRNVFHLAAGRMALWDNLHKFRIIEGPFSEISQPGQRRIALALTDCEGSNIFETSAATWQEAEAELFCPLTLPEYLPKTVHALGQFCGCPIVPMRLSCKSA